MPPIALTSWPRENFEPGGGPGMLCFAAFGYLQMQPPIDREKYRSAQVPPGFTMMVYDRTKQTIGFDEFFTGRPWRLASETNPAIAKSCEAAGQLVVFRGETPDPANLDYLRDAVGIMRYLFDQGATAIFDPLTYELWTPREWDYRLFAHGKPVLHEHVMILRTPQGNGEQFQTRGLRKFGRPDLSVQNVADRYGDAVLELLNLYIGFQTAGGIILDGDIVTLETLPPDGMCIVPEDWPTERRLDNYDNDVVEIVWPGNGLAE